MITYVNDIKNKLLNVFLDFNSQGFNPFINLYNRYFSTILI